MAEGFKIAEGYVEVNARVDKSDVNRAGAEAGRSYGDAFSGSAQTSMRSHRDVFASEGGEAGTRYANGFARDASGRLHGALGRFVAEGRDAGDKFGDGFRRGSRRGFDGWAKDLSTVGSSLSQLTGPLMSAVSAVFSLQGAMVVGGIAAVALAGSLGLAGASAAAVIPMVFGLVSVLGTVIAAFTGVMGALKAYSAQQKAAGGAAGDSAAQQEAAAERIANAQYSLAQARKAQARAAEDAADRIANAQQQLADAQQRELQAQQDLHDARQQAIQDIEDMKDAARDSAISEESAAIRLERQKIRTAQIMADATASDLDRREALNDLARAQADYDDAVENNTKSQEDLNDAQSKGVEGSDVVIKAKENEVKAQKDVIDSQKNLAKVQRDAADAQEEAAIRVARAVHELELAQKKANAATGGGAAAANQYAEAMKKLTPEGRAAVLALIAFGKALKPIQQTAERTFLPGFTSFLNDTIHLLPTVTTHVGRMGTILGESIQTLGRFFNTPLFKGQLQNIFGEIEDSTRAMAGALTPFAAAITSIAEAAAPLMTRMSEALSGMVAKFAAFIEAKRQSKELQAFFKRAGDEFAKWWKIFGNIIVSIFNIIKAATPTGQAIASWLSDITDKLKEWTGSAEGQQKIKDFFDAIAKIDPQHVLAVATAVTALGAALKGMAAISGLAGAIGPLLSLGPVGLIALGVAAAIGLIAAAIALLYVNSKTYRDFVNDRLMNVWNTIKDTILPALKQAIDSITKTVQDNKDELRELWGWFKQISDIVIYILLPAFAQLIAFMIKNFASMVNTVITIIGAWVRTINMIKNAFDATKNAAGAAIDWIIKKFNDVVGFIGGLPSRISKATAGMWDGIKSAFKSAINWVIGKWNSLEFPAVRIGPVQLTPPVGTPNIPFLARGGKIVGSGRVVVGDAGPEILELPHGATVRPLDKTPAPASTGRNVVINNLNLKGVWDFTDKTAARRLIANLWDELDRYEKEHA